MRSNLRLAALLVLTSGLAVAPACTDRLPTFTGTEGFPEELISTSLEYVVDAEEFLRTAAVYEAGTTALDFPGFVVARDFDGVLDAHVLADPGVFPDTLLLDGAVDSTFVYDSGRVAAAVDSVDYSSSPLSFSLWELSESFEADSATWENRIDRPTAPVSWSEAGGTRGALLGVVNWTRPTGAARDSIVWSIPGAVLQRLSSGALPGLLVTLEGAGERAAITQLSIVASIQPTARPDTLVTRTIPTEQTFIFTPDDAPRPDGLLRVGGLRSDRTILRLNLPASLPGCKAGEICADVLPSRVSINRADLVLEPVAVTGGFRPLAPGQIFVRSVLEPDLGARAPLGNLIHAPRTPTGAIDLNARNYFANQFVPGAPGGPVSLLLTSAVAEAFETGNSELSVALLVEPEASRFGVAWFSPRPTLRLVYTLPQIPQLP